jgi:hypothetical protein
MFVQLALTIEHAVFYEKFNLAGLKSRKFIIKTLVNAIE